MGLEHATSLSKEKKVHLDHTSLQTGTSKSAFTSEIHIVIFIVDSKSIATIFADRCESVRIHHSYIATQRLHPLSRIDRSLSVVVHITKMATYVIYFLNSCTMTFSCLFASLCHVRLKVFLPENPQTPVLSFFSRSIPALEPIRDQNSEIHRGWRHSSSVHNGVELL